MPSETAIGKLFKPGLSKPESKQQTTTNVARSLMDAETVAREKKTAKLRELRLQKEAADAEAAAALPAAAPKKRAAKKASAR